MGAILRGKWAIKPKGEIGGKQRKGGKTLNHYSIVELTSIAYCSEPLPECFQ